MGNQFEPIVIIDNVSYMYPRSKEPVLKHISLQIYKGEFLGIIGPTGAGKSTFCLALNGIVPQFFGGRFFGSISINGLDTVDHPISTLANHVGSVFEDPETQLVSATVENEIAFALENQCLPKEEILKRIPEALSKVRLEGCLHKHPQELSGGQKQRLAIAAAIALRPDLLILDEPTSQLDPIGTQEVFSIVRELNKDFGMTIVMAGHAAEEIAEYADRLVILSNGEIINFGNPEEIYSDVELILNNHLRPPQVTSTFFNISKKGIKTNRIPVTMYEGLKDFRNLIEKYSICSNLKQSENKNDHQETIFSVQNLKHVYKDGTEALKNISLDISAGEYVLIIGQNGAGKSTLVKHFLNLLSPTEGNVKVNGINTKDLSVSELARKIGYVAQNPDNQIFNSTVGEEVSFALRNLKFSKDEIEQRTVDSLEAMGLLPFRNVHPLSLPKGDRARVVIAAILAMKPEIIIFDEPTTGQDYKGAQYILDISKQLHQMGKTIIVITHHLYLMPEYAERVIIMGKGTILLDAPIRKAFHEVDLLKSTFLTPPQSILLAKELEDLKGMNFPLLTPTEVADVFMTNHEGCL